MSSHIGLNAHLISAAKAGYRRAGIHRYISSLLAHLPEAHPAYRYTALVGAGTLEDAPMLPLRRAHWRTDSPVRRIIWEQLVQPWSLGDFDLVHELAFVAPLLMPRPFVVTVYDL